MRSILSVELLWIGGVWLVGNYYPWRFTRKKTSSRPEIVRDSPGSRRCGLLRNPAAR